MDFELEDHIKHCSCTCNHMGYGNFMDYQTSCFSTLPDVTEHSNHRHQISCEPTIKANALLSSETNAIIVSPRNVTSIESSRRTSMNRGVNPAATFALYKSHGQSLGNTDSNHTSSSNIVSQRQIINNKKKYFLLICSSIFVLTTSIIIAGILLIEFLLKDISIISGYRMENSVYAGNSFDGNYPTAADHFELEHRLKIVRDILKDTPLIDGHNNLPWNIRNYARNGLEYFNFEEGLDKTDPWRKSVWSQTDLPRLKRGLVGAQFWSAYVPCEAQGLDAVQLALEQIDLIQRFTDIYAKHMVLVLTSEEILNVHRQGLIASMVGVEGGHAIGSSLSVLRSMYSLGARYLTLTHKCDNTWAGSANSNNRGLTPFGKVVIQEMNRLGMMIDLSHSSDATVYDVLRVTRAPVILSHSAARSLCNSTRNIGDDLLRLVAETGGIIMVSFYSLHIACSQSATIRDVIAHLNYIRDIAGIEHIGIGAGYDGIDLPPHGLEDVSRYPILFAELLRDPSWNDGDLKMLAGKNLIRVMDSVEKVRDYFRHAAVTPLEAINPPNHSPCTYMQL